MLAIIVNCSFMTLPEPPPWIDEYMEYLFMSVYTLEAIIKIIARGFWCNKLAYIRDPWNWLDFFVIISAYFSEALKVFDLMGSATGQGGGAQPTVLRGFKVFRVLKTMSIVPGLRSIVQALLHSIRALKDAIVLTSQFSL